MACILFVDDDYFTLETYDKILTLLGHQTILSESAGQALLLAEIQQPDLIVVDMHLLDMDGFEFLKRLKSNPATVHIPAVMVSASPEIYAQRAIAAGALEYLTKPVYPEKLLEIIEQNRVEK
jgi:CheY-like chemotaxis protein